MNLPICEDVVHAGVRRRMGSSGVDTLHTQTNELFVFAEYKHRKADANLLYSEREREIYGKGGHFRRERRGFRGKGRRFMRSPQQPRGGEAQKSHVSDMRGRECKGDGKRGSAGETNVTQPGRAARRGSEQPHNSDCVMHPHPHKEETRGQRGRKAAQRNKKEKIQQELSFSRFHPNPPPNTRCLLFSVPHAGTVVAVKTASSSQSCREEEEEGGGGKKGGGEGAVKKLGAAEPLETQRVGCSSCGHLHRAKFPRPIHEERSKEAQLWHPLHIHRGHLMPRPTKGEVRRRRRRAAGPWPWSWP
eukprot:RCo051925